MAIRSSWASLAGARTCGHSTPASQDAASARCRVGERCAQVKHTDGGPALSCYADVSGLNSPRDSRVPCPSFQFAAVGCSLASRTRSPSALSSFSSLEVGESLNATG